MAKPCKGEAVEQANRQERHEVVFPPRSLGGSGPSLTTRTDEVAGSGGERPA